MIIRHIPMKKARLSSFASLVHYLCNQQNKQERVGKVSVSHCHSEEPLWAVQEVLATQAKNQRAQGDKTYHLLISFAADDNPSPDALRAIEERVVASIGFSEHQRISVIHHDTDNLHIHLAINKIHPQSLNMMEPFRAYKVFAEVAMNLEKEFHLQITNHQSRKSRSENLADDMEQHSGIESLINWMKRQCKEELEAANDWKTVHKVLAKHGMHVYVKANGFVFCDDDGLTIKASSVSRQFSKYHLEKKLGEFEPLITISNTYSSNRYHYEPLDKKMLDSALYEQYQREKCHSKNRLSTKLKHLGVAKAQLIEKAKKRGRIKRGALKLMKLSKMNKKFLYQQISKTLLHDIEKIRNNYKHARYRLIDSHQNKTWMDWLKQKAQAGDNEALTALRYRNRKSNSHYRLSGNNAAPGTFNSAQIDSITKEGTTIYKVDKGVIRDNGHEIKISKGGSIEVLKKAIEMAQSRYGNCISVHGSPLFKKTVAQIVVQHQIPITFADSEMEQLRQKLTLEKEISHEQLNKYRNHHRRRTARSPETSGAATRSRNPKTKSNPHIAKRRPPAENQNSLRNLSQLDVVQLAGRSQMLLPDNASHQLERKRVEFDHHVRWSIPRIK